MSAGWDWHSFQLQKGASTAMSNYLQAGIGTVPSCKRKRGQNAAQLLFLRFFCADSSDCRFPLFPITTPSYSPKNCSYGSTCLFAAVYNKFTGGGGGCCVSPPEHLAHLIPFFFACLSFVLSQSPIVPS
jgi:hypothetical protein